MRDGENGIDDCVVNLLVGLVGAGVEQGHLKEGEEGGRRGREGVGGGVCELYLVSKYIFSLPPSLLTSSLPSALLTIAVGVV